MPIPTLRPLRLTHGPESYVFTYVRDLEGEIVIDKIYMFDDAAPHQHGTPIRFDDLPQIVKFRYWGLVS